MKPSKRNQERAEKKAARLSSGPPRVSKYEAKVRAELTHMKGGDKR